MVGVGVKSGIDFGDACQCAGALGAVFVSKWICAKRTAGGTRWYIIGIGLAFPMKSIWCLGSGGQMRRGETPGGVFGPVTTIEGIVSIVSLGFFHCWRE